MSQDSNNPFAIPGLNAAFMSGPNNPLLTSMDMMRQAMGSMGYGGQTTASQGMANPMAPEELEKRIADLKVVENWLKLNLSMLSSTIQGMEVQLATVKTLQSFVAMGQSAGTSSDAAASPLEIALGLKPAPEGPQSAAQTASAPQSPPTPQAEPEGPPPEASSTQSPQETAAKGWWNMLETQFAQLAAATANAAKANQEHLQKATASAKTGATTPKKATKRPATKKTARQTRAAKKTAS